jgi:hypothetical protein
MEQRQKRVEEDRQREGRVASADAGKFRCAGAPLDVGSDFSDPAAATLVVGPDRPWGASFLLSRLSLLEESSPKALPPSAPKENNCAAAPWWPALALCSPCWSISSVPPPPFFLEVRHPPCPRWYP